MNANLGRCQPVIGLVFLPSILTCSAQQWFLVQWDGAYLERQTGGEKLNLPGETIFSGADQQTEGVGFPYNEDEPISPAAAGYDATKPSAVFYGVLEVLSPGARQENYVSTLRFLNTVVANYGKNMINMVGTDSVEEGGTARIRGLVYWLLKDSPIALAHDGKVRWSDIQCLFIDVSKINGKLGSFRFAAQSGGKWYLSQVEGNRTGWTTMSDTSWAEWPVAGSFPMPPMPDTFPISSDALTAVGVAFTGASDAPSRNAVFGFKAFYAEAVPDFVK